MLFSYKSIILYGLLAISHAYPLNDLSKRAKIGDFLCPDGNTIAESDVRTAFSKCRSLNDGAIGKYPAAFGNKRTNNELVFSNIPSSTKLREFPIIVGGEYTKGEPGPYRVVTDYKNNKGDFRGVMQHTGATVGGGYTACTLVANDESKKEDKGKRDSSSKDKHDNDDDKQKHDKDTASKRDSSNKDKHDNDDDKEKHDTKKSVQSTSRRSTPSDSTNELTTRAKKKKVGSATCDDGTTLSQDDVAAAFIECKKYDDYGVGGYPHGFGNMSGNDQVFQGVTKALREYPIVEGGTWTGNSSPGKYRVVTDYNNNFVGVMIESAGASFSRCTINSD